MIIWFASGNVHKKRELAGLLAGWTVLMPRDAGLEGFDPEESGNTFAENSLLKARALYALLKKLPQTETGAVIADDSGLCVDALDGRPGILSARYGSIKGEKLTDAERNVLLLKELDAAAAFKAGKRSARFVCAMTLLFDENRFVTVQETLEGEIVSDMNASRGKGGFGYDPVLYIPGLGRTVAELSEAEKNRLSHRGKAAGAIRKYLE